MAGAGKTLRLYVYLAAIAAAGWMIVAPCLALAEILEPFETTTHPFWVIDEVRAGAFKQAIDNAPGEGTAAMNLEVLGGRFAGEYNSNFLDFLFTPRPHIGTTLAFGKTDELYFGFTWDAKLPIDRLFLEASLGGAVHDGPLDEPGVSSYGCTLNFRESASLGFALTPEWRLLGTIDHMSNGNFCMRNRGLTNAGVRLGIKF